MKTMKDARELLVEYVRSGSEPAFRELVARYVDLVYSTALRRLGGDSHQAEDVTQTVFLRLSRKARNFSGEISLGGWLHRDTCHVAATVMRGERRRLVRERQAAEMNTLEDNSEANLSQILPVLDEAINELGSEDRTAIILRFYEQSDFRSVAASLRSSEDAARMRVNRALEKLHGALRSRGVALSAAGLAMVLGSKVIVAAPAGLAAGIVAAVSASAGAISGGLFSFQSGLTKWKLAALSGAALVAVLSLYLAAAHREISPRPQTPPVTSAVAVENPRKSLVEQALAPALPADATTPTVPSMSFRVVDAETGAPLWNAKLGVNYFREAGKMKGTKLTTDASGEAQIELPQSPFTDMNVFVTADGHVPKVVDWHSGFSEFPTNYIMKVETGTRVGGLVVDDTQQPVANVKIEFHGPGIDRANKEHIQFGPDTAQRTDSGGYWACDIMPVNLETIEVALSHPDFAATVTNIPVNSPEALHTVLMIRKGIKITGLVEDLSGQPIAGASIRQIHNRREPKLSAKTDLSGRFVLSNLLPGELALAIQANSFSPVVLETNVANAPVELIFSLAPGHLLRGRVLDAGGAPIAEAVAQTDWDNQGLRKIEWSVRTDAQGRFEWDSAPAEPVLYWFEAPGYEWSRMKLLKADGTEHEIRLSRKGSPTAPPPVKVTGTVVDEETGQALDDFRVLIGEIRRYDSAPEFSFGTDGREGNFSLKLGSPRLFQAYQIQIQKDGYLPVATANLFVKDGNQVLEFKLCKGSGPSGMVVFPTGEPAAEATVFLYEARGGVYMDKPGQFRKDSGISTENRVQTDGSGKFSFAPKLLARGLIVIHEFGYADVPIAAFGDRITLQPWGRVEGRLLLGRQPAAGEQISLGNVHYRYGGNGREFPALSLWLSATTDAEGNFAFEKVPPGERTICQRLAMPENQTGVIHETQKRRIVVAAGTVMRVELGGTGRPVAGRAVMPEGSKSVEWQKVVVKLSLKLPGSPGSRPMRADFSTTEEFIAAAQSYAATERAFWTSRPGLAIERAQRNYAARCSVDGTFLLPDVPPGDYELKIEVKEMKPRSGSVGPSKFQFEAREVGALSTIITVPTLPDDSAAHPVDLGVLQLKEASPR